MESIKELKKKVAKSNVSHFAPRHDVIVRQISIYLTWLFLHTSISANSITLLQIIIGLVGATFLIPSSYPWNFAGILLLQFGYILDCSDGEVARYRQQSSVNGIFLDLIGHEIVIPFMYMALALGEYQRSDRLEVLIFGFSASLFSLRFDISAMFQTVNTMFSKFDNPSYNFDLLNKSTKSHTTQLATTKPSILRTIFRYPESMNIISAILLLDWLLPFYLPLKFTFIYIFLLIFGIAIPIARILSIYKIFRSGETEARYLEIFKTIQQKLKASKEGQ